MKKKTADNSKEAHITLLEKVSDDQLSRLAKLQREARLMSVRGSRPRKLD